MKTGSASVLDDAAAAGGASAGLRIRPATAADLPGLNGVVERAVMTWKLPERVRRLALPSYRYHTHDLDHQRLLVAVWPDVGIVGVAALEEADPRDLPGVLSGLLLHGLYVDPDWQHRGIGSRLLAAAGAACRESGHAGLLVKAQPDAAAFFQARGLLRLAVKDPDRDYPYRYWMPADRHTGNAATATAWCCITPV